MIGCMMGDLGWDGKAAGHATHPHAQVKVVLGPSAHDTVEAVDGVWHAELGVEERVDLLGVAKVRLAGDDVLGALGRLGLDNVAEDEADVGG